MTESARAPRLRVVVAEDAYLIREFLSAILSAAPEVELVAVCSDMHWSETQDTSRRVKATLIFLSEEENGTTA